MRQAFARWSSVQCLTVALTGLFALSAGCSITQPSGRAVSSQDLERNRQRWASAQLHDYDFDYQLSCFCAPNATEAVHIAVRNDAVVSVVRTRDGLPANNGIAWPRVDELFAGVERRLALGAARLDVTYDPTLGYPRSIIVDVNAMAVDDESTQSASNLRSSR
jgi:hypothetical protein